MSQKSSFFREISQKLGFSKHPVVWGLVLLWVGSIGFTVKLFNLLYIPFGYDPSFDYVVAAFFILILLIGIWIIVRNILATAGKLGIKNTRFLNIAMIATCILLVVDLISGALIYSANAAFLRGYSPMVMNEPRPDYSVPTFPLPVNPQPTPTYDPSAIHLSGNILSSLDGLRIGQISISLSPSLQTINSIQLYIFSIGCSVQQGDQVSTFAVAESKPFIWGPIEVQDQSFYVNQRVAAIHGIVASASEAHGTIYLYYGDEATNRTCDLGTANWTVAPAP